MMIRTLMGAATLLVVMPADAATIVATPATIAAAIAAAQPGDTIQLAPGEYGALTIARSWTRQVTVNAGGATIRGLVITGGGVRWRSGVLAATAGAHGFAGSGYGVRITGRNVRLDGVLVTDAKKGVVLDGAAGITIADSRFLRLGEDGVIASRTVGLTIVRNRFAETIGKPTSCATPTGAVLGLANRDCLARGGAWTDGYHADAVQIRNGVADAVIADNAIEGGTQGIGQMDGTTDAPLARVTVERNRIAVSWYHTVTLTNCSDCIIRRNVVRRTAGSAIRAVIRAGAARRCENDVQDDKPDGACSTDG